MRKIKFRAWDEEDQESKIMIYSDKRNKGDYPINYDFTINKNGEVVCIWIEDDDKFSYTATRSGQLNNLMQYTGLKDCSNNEIYEGDILSTRYGIVAVVEWENEGRFLGFTNERERKIVYINREPKVKVIGNIYENPELLGMGGKNA